MAIDFSSMPRRSLIGGLLRFPLRLLPDGVEVRVLQGPLRGARWIVGASTHGCWLGSYELAKQSAFARFVYEGAIVYDVGANVGLYSLLAASRAGTGGTVVAFEPLPRNVKLLRQHLALNGFTDVTVMEAAVAARGGWASFAPGPDPSQGALRDSGALRVRTVSLDEFVAAGAAPAPDVVKIDVEGAELEVLTGARHLLEQQRPVIFLATHGEELRRRCLDLLIARSYRIRSLGGGSLDTGDEFLALPARDLRSG